MQKIDLKKIGIINRNFIIRILQKNREIPQKGIVSMTGLQKSTISIIINDMISEGVIVKRGEGSVGKKGGRKPVMLELNVKDRGFILVHLIRSEIHCVVVDIYGGELWKKDVHLSDDDFKIGIKDLILEVRKVFPAMKIEGVGISVPGVVDCFEGEIIYSAQLGVSKLKLQEYLSQFYDGVMILENNANLSAIAEKSMGLCQQTNDFLVFFLEFHFIDGYYRIGLGSGLMIDGKIYRGTNFSSGEISEILNVIVQDKLKPHVSYFSEKLRKESGLQFHESNLSQVLLLAEKGDSIAVNVIKDIANELGKELALIVNYLDPEKVIIDGSISPYYNSFFVSELKTGIYNGLFTFLKNSVSIEVSVLKKNVLSVGLLKLLVDKIYPIPDLDVVAPTQNYK